MQGLARAWQRRGALARVLWPLSLLYGWVAGRRRAAFRDGRRPVEKAGIPVVVVGNLIAGGAGKTPTVLAVVELLRRDGWAPGIVSRGYGRRDDGGCREVGPHSTATDVGDEPLLLRRRAGVPVVVGRDRPAAARALRRAHPAVDVLVSDDGLQHRALHRDLEILVFDDRGAGNGWLLPAGPLREPLPSSVGPDQLVLYNAARSSTALPGFVARRRLGGAVALDDWWQGRPASVERLRSLAGRPLVAAAGMAHPDRFFSMLRDQGLAITPLPLPDHHDFARLPWPAGTPDVLVTEKDAVKLQPASAGGSRVWVVTLDFDPGPDFAARVLERLRPLRPR